MEVLFDPAEDFSLLKKVVVKLASKRKFEEAKFSPQGRIGLSGCNIYVLELIDTTKVVHPYYVKIANYSKEANKWLKIEGKKFIKYADYLDGSPPEAVMENQEIDGKEYVALCYRAVGSDFDSSAKQLHEMVTDSLHD